MFNFSGTTKKRVVNLGNRTSGGASLGFLEKQNLQRQEREKQRREQAAAETLQRAIQRVLDLRRAAATLPVPSDPQLFVPYTKFVATWGVPQQLASLLPKVVEQVINGCDQVTVSEFVSVVNLCVRLNYNDCARQLVVAGEDRFFPGEPGTYPGLLKVTGGDPTLSFKVGVNDNVNSFWKYLQTAPPTNSPVVNHAFSQVIRHLSTFTDPELVELLACYLRSSSDIQIPVVDAILSSIKTSIDSDDDDGIDIDAPGLSKLSLLYTSEFLNRLFDTPQYLLSTLASLMQLIPEFRIRLCIPVCANRRVFAWIHIQLTQNPGYETFTCNDPNFRKMVYTFSELLSFYLVVTNDVELKQDQQFKLNEIATFGMFIKNTVVNIICKQIPGQEYVKRAGIKVLNQLHSRNYRLNFLPKAFHELTNVSIETNWLLSVYKDRLEDNGNHQHVAPQLEILEQLPFLIDFMERVKLFRKLLSNPGDYHYGYSRDLEAQIRRGHVLEDGLAAYGNKGNQFHNRLRIQFTNDETGAEVGIDGGGLTKEFLTATVSEAFAPDMGLFIETANHQYYPNPNIFYKLSTEVDVDQEYAELHTLRYLGIILGKFLYEEILVDVPFAPFFLKKWCKNLELNSINDLSALDPELYHSLMQMEQMSAEEIDELGLTFSIDENINGTIVPFPLLPGGDQIAVTRENRLNYIHQLADFRLNRSVKLQTQAFLQGLYQVIDSSKLVMFDAHELKLLISGEDHVNVDEWQCQSVVGGGYHDEDVTIANFWQVVREISTDDQKKLLRYVTSVGRPPLTGFASLNPPFTINFAGKDLSRLPTASTCVNLLKLPDYKDKEKIREKLLFVIRQDAGFDLS